MPCFNATIWSPWHNHRCSQTSLAWDLTRYSNFCISVPQTWGGRSIKCVFWENSIQSHWFFFPALHWSDRLKIVLASAHCSKSSYFSFCYMFTFVPFLMGLKMSFLLLLLLLFLLCVESFWIPAYFRSTSVESNSPEPCNVVTLIDFPLNWKNPMKQAPWLANKSWLPKSPKN